MTRLAGAKVLVIDADILLAVHLTDELARQGAEIPTVVPSADRAMAAARDPDITAAVVDPYMDAGNPKAAIEQLLERHVPVLLTSLLPYERQPDLVRKRSFVRKPFAPRTMALRLADMIDGVTVLDLHPRPLFTE